MVPRFLKILNRDVTTMNQAAFVLAVFSILSQIFGLMRDHLLASRIGPSNALDIYYAAFRIPDFIYNSFGILFSVTVLIPFITQYLEEEKISGNSIALKKFLNSVFTVFSFGMVTLSAILLVLMPYLTRLTAPGFDAVSQAQLVEYSRILLISPFLFGLSSLLSSFAQVQKKFFSFAIAPLFYNLGILIGILFFRPQLGMVGVVYGVVLGALLHFLIQIPTLVSLKKIPKFDLNIDWQIIKRVMTLSLPRTLGSSLTNITFVIISAIASLMAAGSISVFQFSYNIENTPLLIIGVSYAVAAFPTMARLFSEDNKKELIQVLYSAARNILFLAIPASLLIIVLRAHIVRLLLGAGVFSWNDTRLVAASVALFSVSVAAQCMVLLMVRAYYAVGDTKNPLKINGIAVLTTLISIAGLLLLYRDVPMFKYFLDSLMRIDGVDGGMVIILPLGFSIGQIINAAMLWSNFHKKFPGTRAENQNLSKNIYHIISASIIGAASAYGILQVAGPGVDQNHFTGVMIQAFISGVVGLAMYGIILKALRNEDINLFIATLRSKFWKEKPVVVPQQPDL